MDGDRPLVSAAGVAFEYESGMSWVGAPARPGGRRPWSLVVVLTTRGRHGVVERGARVVLSYEPRGPLRVRVSAEGVFADPEAAPVVFSARPGRLTPVSGRAVLTDARFCGLREALVRGLECALGQARLFTA